LTDIIDRTPTTCNIAQKENFQFKALRESQTIAQAPGQIRHAGEDLK